MARYNRILWRTHDKKFSLLLHLRSFHIDVARKWHDIQNILTMVPIIVLIAVYACYYFLDIPGFDEIDVVTITVAVSLFISFLTALIEIKIVDEKKISDKYREMYDCRVFEISPDEFLVDLSEADADRKELEKRCFDKRLGPPDKRYSAWYEEIFSNSDACNVICCQVQNISFSRDLYRHMVGIYVGILVSFILAVGMICLIIGVFQDFYSTVPIISAVAPKLLLLFKTMLKSDKIWKKHQEVIDILTEGKDRFSNSTELDLRKIQSHMFRAREDDIIVPRRIYDNFVKDMHDRSSYWRQFAELYGRGQEMKSPSSAEDVMVVGRNYDCEKDGGYMMLSEMQARVWAIMKEIHEIFTTAEPPIRYYIDGGTLIDIERPEHPVFWDDDMDISIMSEDLERAKSILAEKLSDGFVVQDESDKYFIPYACKFRVRDKGTTTEELDNSMYPYFDEDKRGVFIDVYAMIPPLSNRCKEKGYRVVMKGLYKRMKKVEERIYINTPPESYTDEIPEKRRTALKKDLESYVKLKRRYLGIENRYISEKRRDEDKMVCLPSYSCEDSKLPVYDREDVVSDDYDTVEWNGITLNVPKNPDNILTAFYGNWREPKNDYTTILKHIYTCDKK